HLRAGSLERLVEAVGPGAVVLHGGAEAAQVVAGEVVDDLGGGAVGGDPVDVEADALGGAAGLGAAGEDAGAGERGAQGGGDTGGVGGLEPAAHAHTGGGDQQLGRVRDEL